VRGILSHRPTPAELRSRRVVPGQPEDALIALGPPLWFAACAVVEGAALPSSPFYVKTVSNTNPPGCPHRLPVTCFIHGHCYSMVVGSLFSMVAGSN
jgi:hypothetical protein